MKCTSKPAILITIVLLSLMKISDASSRENKWERFRVPFTNQRGFKHKETQQTIMANEVEWRMSYNGNREWNIKYWWCSKLPSSYPTIWQGEKEYNNWLQEDAASKQIIAKYSKEELNKKIEEQRIKDKKWEAEREKMFKEQDIMWRKGEANRKKEEAQRKKEEAADNARHKAFKKVADKVLGQKAITEVECGDCKGKGRKGRGFRRKTKCNSCGGDGKVMSTNFLYPEVRKSVDKIYQDLLVTKRNHVTQYDPSRTLSEDEKLREFYEATRKTIVDLLFDADSEEYQTKDAKQAKRFAKTMNRKLPKQLRYECVN